MLFSELNGLLGWSTKTEQIDSRMAVHPFGLSSLSPPLPLSDPFSHPSSPSPSPFPAFVNVCLEGLSANQQLPLAVVHAELQRTAPSWTATVLHLLLGERLPVREGGGGWVEDWVMGGMEAGRMVSRGLEDEMWSCSTLHLPGRSLHCTCC